LCRCEREDSGTDELERWPTAFMVVVREERKIGEEPLLVLAEEEWCTWICFFSSGDAVF
jgi:hypothetical protein